MNDPKYGFQKGEGYHLDLAVLGGITSLLLLLGFGPLIRHTTLYPCHRTWDQLDHSFVLMILSLIENDIAPC